MEVDQFIDTGAFHQVRPGSKAYLLRRREAEMMGRINHEAYFHRNERHTPASHVYGVLACILSDKRNVERVEHKKQQETPPIGWDC